MNIVLGIIIGLFVLMFLITAHEFGHFIAARRSGVRVKEFGICFPPRLMAWVKGEDGKWYKIPKAEWDKEQKGLIFSINCLPIGGFCAMDGESDADTRKGTFGAASFWSKTKILFAGVAMNWIVAFIVLTILAWTGMPQFMTNQFRIENDSTMVGEPVVVSNVVENSPAQKAGFLNNDKILEVDGNKIITGTDIVNYNQEHAGQEVSYKIRRLEGSGCDDKLEENQNCKAVEKDLKVKLNTQNAEYLLGVAMTSSQTLMRSTWSAPIVGAATTVQLTGETFKGLGTLVWNLFSGLARQVSFNGDVREEGRQAIGAAGDGVSGPVGIIGVIFPQFTQAGPTNLAFLAALISVSLACMNVIPIPALDGGRWLMMAICRLRGKKLKKQTEEKIVGRAFIALLVLVAVITILDIVKFF